jgi:ABC-type phosphate/phosphonate transport system substrate-binding protein
MLPCNVIVQEMRTDEVEIAAVDPIASMQAVKNEALMPVATEVQRKLKKVIDSV